jgi:predicted nuclease with TOPRIM domain
MLVSSLRVEKKHLESTLRENIELKDAFRAKNEELQNKYEEIFKECEHYKRQLVGIDELRKDRDERLEQLRKEIDDLT